MSSSTTEPGARPPNIQVLGVRVDMVQAKDVLNTMDRWIQERDACRWVVATGMHGVMEAHKDSSFKSAINTCDLFVPDGISLVWIARRHGYSLKKRVSGPDLMNIFFAHAEVMGHSNFFYGDTQETLDQLLARLKSRFPLLKIAGSISPPFRQLTEEEEAYDIKIINESGADVLWVGLGLPKQDWWIHRNKNTLNVPVAAGVGASFKFLSGRVRRAPAWIGDLGFEWLWRLAHEPRRVWRRVVVDGPQFVYLVAREMFGRKKTE